MFDLNDPYGWLTQSRQPMQRQPLNLQPLSPQEEEGLLGRIGGKMMGGLGYVGSVLDKTLGGRAVRAGLHGLTGGNIDPTELLSFVPGSDTFGLTDEKNRVSGKDVLGLKGDDWGSTLSGIGAEIALDPATYLSFGAGALTKSQAIARGVAKDIGVLPGTLKGTLGETLNTLVPRPMNMSEMGGQVGARHSKLLETLPQTGKTIAQLGDQPLGAIAGLGLPFQEPLAQFGTGAGGKAFLDTLGRGAGAVSGALSKLPLGIGGAYEATKNAAQTAGRYGGALFDRAARGTIGVEAQRAAREATGAEDAAMVAARKQLLGWGEDLAKADQGGRTPGLRAYVEGIEGNYHPATVQVGDAIRYKLDNYLEQYAKEGVDVTPLQDMVRYMTRQRTPVGVQTKGFEEGAGLGGGLSKPFNPHDPRLTDREDILKNIPGGTEKGINPMSVDPVISGPKRSAANDLGAAQHVRQTYLNWTPQMEHELWTLKTTRHKLTDPALTARLAELEAGEAKSMGLADMMHKLDPARNIVQEHGPTQGQPLFGYHPLKDAETYFGRAERSLANARTMSNTFAREAVDAATAAGKPGYVSAAKALEAAGIHSGQSPATLAERLRATGKPVNNVLDLNNWYIPESVVNDLTRAQKGLQAPDMLKGPLGLLDWGTQLNKAYQTVLWPAFHVRNLISGQAMNASRAGLGSLGEAAGAKALLGGEALPGAGKVAGMSGMSDLEASRALAHEAAAHTGLQMHANVGQGVIQPRGQGAKTLEELRSVIPGEQPATLGTAWNKLTEPNQNWNPLDVQNFPPLRAGHEVGNIAEGTNRMSMYAALRKQGFSEGEAARRTLASHFDYGDLSSFERDVMRRAVPFYTYGRKNLGEMSRAVMEHPGGLEGMTARVGHDLRQQEGFLPENLGQGLAVPVGVEEAGHRKYLTKTDVPIEQATETLHGGPNAGSATLESLMSQMNPFLKAPIEYATGKQLFTGRDAAPSILETALMNSPLSRFASTGHTLAQQRNWQDPYTLPLNLAAGLKINDIDMAKMREAAGREAIHKLLGWQQNIGKYQQVFVRPGQEATLTPEELELLRLNKNLEQQAIQRSRAGRP